MSLDGLGYLYCHTCKKEKEEGKDVVVMKTFTRLGELNVLGNMNILQEMVKFLDSHEGHMISWNSDDNE